ncbi:hypothetical protein GJAV_G00271490 [Gymnothorax javanicus]|nr:hypothetical protein GJAV_G00271490 [Gymnothorax javanicus]
MNSQPECGDLLQPILSLWSWILEQLAALTAVILIRPNVVRSWQIQQEKLLKRILPAVRLWSSFLRWSQCEETGSRASPECSSHRWRLRKVGADAAGGKAGCSNRGGLSGILPAHDDSGMSGNLDLTAGEVNDMSPAANTGQSDGRGPWTGGRRLHSS